MSIETRIQAINDHLIDDYSVLELAGADLTGVDKNIVNLKMSWKERLLYFMNNGTQEVWNNWNKVNGSGETVSLSNTEEAPMSLTYKGDTYQATGEGKNLADISVIPDLTGTPTVTVANDTITISNNSSAAIGTVSTTKKLSELCPLLEVGDTVYLFFDTTTSGTYDNFIHIQLSTYPINVWWEKGTSQTITQDMLDGTISIFGGKNSTTVISHFMITKTNDSTYEPYTGGPYPSPSNPSPVQVVSGDNSIEVKGYNLYNANDTNAVANGYIIQSDGTLKLNEIDNTSGSSPIFKNFVLPITQFKANITYSFVLEILSVSGTGHITTNEANATTQFNAISSLASKTFDSLHAGDIIVGTATTKADFTNCTRALSSYCYFLAGEKGSITFRLSIIEGSSVTPQTFTYQPYKSASYPISLGNIELCKIGTYQDKIDKSTGKNIFDKDNANVLNAYIGQTGTISAGTGDRTIYISCKPNTTYTIQKMVQGTLANNRFRAGTSTSTPALNGTVSQYYNAGNGNNTTSYTITTNDSAKYIVFNCYYDDSATTFNTMLGSIMISESTSTQNYEPYGKVWYLKKEIGKVVLNGSENWETQWSEAYVKGYHLVINNLKQTTSQTDTSYLLCNNYPVNTQLSVYQDGNYGICNRATYSQIIIKNNDINSTTDFKTWLSNNNTTVYYVLATPTYETITDTTLLSQLEALKKSYEGQTNISQVNNDLPFELDVVALSDGTVSTLSLGSPLLGSLSQPEETQEEPEVDSEESL